eukprot:1858308-Prymnesium_polylepis.1
MAVGGGGAAFAAAIVAGFAENARHTRSQRRARAGSERVEDRVSSNIQTSLSTRARTLEWHLAGPALR